ncbi:hypothetical protein N657DRAFT_632538 [Parathielavia appendiculata]|uniref:Uncharacterized protein n=1 Tax=Parathielavia appendiculata TaxID=2587402 RepID=A0AAN6U4Z5_9PEZI|nr:hypothetical protein N657DRAFT_632538 [Parathielavia appendiculata]
MASMILLSKFGTTESIHYETSTSYAEVLETITDDSETTVATVTQVVTAPTNPAPSDKKKRGPGDKKRRCVPALSSPDVFVTTTIPAAPLVETVTESSAIPSISTSTVTVIVSSTVVVPATTTLASTTTGLYQKTTTVTSTTTPVAPTQTAYLGVTGMPPGYYVAAVNGYFTINSATAQASPFGLITAGGQPFPPSNPSVKWFVQPTTTYFGVMILSTDAQASVSNLERRHLYYQLGRRVVHGAIEAGLRHHVQAGCTKANFKMSSP